MPFLCNPRIKKFINKIKCHVHERLSTIYDLSLISDLESLPTVGLRLVSRGILYNAENAILMS